MESQNKICAIGIYYGKFKNYFELWLKTCSYNPNIDFIIVTDIKYEKNLPSNVIFKEFTLEEVRNLAIRVTGLNVCLPRPYKTCDLRPLYGEMFKDILTNYEYWGEFDFDMLYGDIWKFMKEYDYQNFDKFLPLGHLSFYRNTADVNNLYTLEGGKRGNYKEILTNPGVFAFDEVDGINSIMLYHNRPLFYKRIFADITPLHSRLTLSELPSTGGERSKNYKHQVFYWSKGRVYRAYLFNDKIEEEEFAYIHLRERPDFEIDEKILESEEFYITKTGFIPKVGGVTKDILMDNNKRESIIIEKMEVLYDRYKAYKKAIVKKLR